MGASMTSRCSPTFRGLITPAEGSAPWSKLVPRTQRYLGVHFSSMPSLMVNHPSCGGPSSELRKMRPRALRAPSWTSVLGPSVTSKASPGCNIRTILLLLANATWSATASLPTCLTTLSSRKVVPWLPFSVAQPSRPSSSALIFTRVRPLSSSSLVSFTNVNVSPTSSFRKIELAFAMSKSSVSAVLVLTTQIADVSKYSLPVESFNVTHPTFPSDRAFPRTRCTSKAVAARGPSRSSSTTPGAAFKTSPPVPSISA
mmetsp:Transcript_91361/g.258029  ORF Transcript_91361/g.258029 Transcript_91361/m.258029 type:complete len:257 (-) Transcript_91361:5128-5898(-)